MTPEVDGTSPAETRIENPRKGISSISIPSYKEPDLVGKVRDTWTVDVGRERCMVIATTDRASAFDRVVGIIPRKGAVLNLLSEFWFDRTYDIVPNHIVSVPPPNITVARKAERRLPVEVIVRGFMAESSTSTSISRHYRNGRRKIYGITFPDGIKPNQELPMGAIITPTTKAEEGQHDEELTDQQALEIVDGQIERGVWNQAKMASLAIFERASAICLEKGLILADTKFEFGLDDHGRLMLIDELLTPDSSRFWLVESYNERFGKGEIPESLDKEILRRWLAERGFKGRKEEPTPPIDPEIITTMTEAYTRLFKMLTGKDLPKEDTEPEQTIVLPNTKLTGFAPTLVHFNRE